MNNRFHQAMIAFFIYFAIILIIGAVHVINISSYDYLMKLWTPMQPPYELLLLRVGLLFWLFVNMGCVFYIGTEDVDESGMVLFFLSVLFNITCIGLWIFTSPGAVPK